MTRTSRSAPSTTIVCSVPSASFISSMIAAIAPGPASIGMAMGKPETSSISGVAATFSARSSRRWVRFSKTISNAIQNSISPPAMRKLSSSIWSAPSSSCPNSAKTSRMASAIRHARIAMARACAAVAPLVSPA